VRQAFDCLGAEPQQCRSFAATDLRTDRAREKSLPTSRACRFEQKISGGQSACTTAAHNRDRDAAAVCHPFCSSGGNPSACWAPTCASSLRRVFLEFFALDQGEDEGGNGKMPYHDHRTSLSTLVISDVGQVYERGTDSLDDDGQGRAACCREIRDAL